MERGNPPEEVPPKTRLGKASIMSRRSVFYLFMGTGLLFTCGYFVATKANLNRSKSVGQVIDEFNRIRVYFNGGVHHSSGRNLAPDGYNLGIKYQCVEFVKRYYFERFGHKMPDSYGHAKDFFNPAVVDGSPNPKRALLQFRNGSLTKPLSEDVLVFGPSLFNPYGHIAIISTVKNDRLEIIQQNPGPFSNSREIFKLTSTSGNWIIENKRVLGWLRIPKNPADR